MDTGLVPGQDTGGFTYVDWSNNHHTLCLLNDAPIHNDPGEYRNINWLLGSQWAYVSAGDPNLLALSWGPDYVHGSGDATDLHNSTYEASADILHASRSFVWLQPDHLVLYDRAASATAGRFKRFWLNLPAAATVTGNVATMTTSSGQRLHVTSLLPAGAAMTSEPDVPFRDGFELGPQSLGRWPATASVRTRRSGPPSPRSRRSGRHG
jgi:hypothetical protein